MTTPPEQSKSIPQAIIVNPGSAVSALLRQLKLIAHITVHDSQGKKIKLGGPETNDVCIASARLQVEAGIVAEQLEEASKANAYYELGCACMMLNEWEIALDAFQHAQNLVKGLKDGPNKDALNISVSNNLGCAYVLLNELQPQIAYEQFHCAHELVEKKPSDDPVKQAVEKNFRLLMSTSNPQPKQKGPSWRTLLSQRKLLPYLINQKLAPWLMPLTFFLIVAVPLVAVAAIPFLRLPTFLPIAVDIVRLIAVFALSGGAILFVFTVAKNYRIVQPWLLELTVGLVSIVFIGALFSLAVTLGSATTPTPTPTPNASVATKFDLASDLIRSDTSNLSADNEIVVVLITSRTDAAGRVTHESSRYAATLISKPNSPKDPYVVRLARGENDGDLLKFVSALADVSDIYLLPEQ